MVSEIQINNNNLIAIVLVCHKNKLQTYTTRSSISSMVFVFSLADSFPPFSQLFNIFIFYYFAAYKTIYNSCLLNQCGKWPIRREIWSVERFRWKERNGGAPQSNKECKWVDNKSFFFFYWTKQIEMHRNKVVRSREVTRQNRTVTLGLNYFLGFFLKNYTKRLDHEASRLCRIEWRRMISIRNKVCKEKKKQLSCQLPSSDRTSPCDLAAIWPLTSRPNSISHITWV